MLDNAGNFLRTFWTPISSFLCLSRTKLCSPDNVTSWPLGIRLTVTSLRVRIFVEVSTASTFKIPLLAKFAFDMVSSTCIWLTSASFSVLTPTATAGGAIVIEGTSVKLDPPETWILEIVLPDPTTTLIVKPVWLAEVPPPTIVTTGIAL